MIGFEYFPAYRRASINAIEMKGKKRSVGGQLIPERIIIPGQFDPLKTAVVANTLVQAFTADEFGQKYGFGSEIHRMAMWVFAHLGGFSENVWALPLAVPTGTPVAAEGDVTFAGTATGSGTFYFSIGGDLISFSVAKGTLAAAVAAAFDAAIDAALKTAVTPSTTDAVTTLTAKWSGATGNEIRIVLNPGGKLQEDANPAGITVTLPTNGLLTSGAGDPVIDDALFNTDGTDKLGDRWYTFFVMPYQDSTSLADLKASWALRFAPETNRFFVAFAGYVRKTYAEALALPAAINAKGICPVWDPRSLAPSFELAAASAGAAMASALLDPGRPFKTLSLGIPADLTVDNLIYAQNDALFSAGMGYCMAVDGVLQLGDTPTTYRTSPAGAATEEWFDAESVTLRQQKSYDVQQLLKGEPYPRAMLATDDTITSKRYVVKPKTLVTALCNLVDYWASQGWTKNPDTVKASIKAEINATYQGRLDSELTDDEAKALRIVALNFQFLY